MRKRKEALIRESDEPFTQNQQSKRLLIAIDLLKKNGIVRSDSDLCRVMGTNIQSFNGVKKGRRNATVELIFMVCEKFYVNPSFIILGDEPIFFQDDNIKTSLFNEKKNTDSEKNLISTLKRELKKSDFLEKLLDIKYWHRRILYLVRTVKDLEKEKINLQHEANTLSNIIADHIVKNKKSKQK